MNLEMSPVPTAAMPPLCAKVSYEEFLALDGEGWAEWVDGEIITTSPSLESHQDLTLFLGSIFSVFVQENHLGDITERHGNCCGVK